MRILYVFPHPDDESFGPARVMSKQRREGHEVHLLTLTKGGATKQRHRYGYSVEEMGDVRYREMRQVEKALDLSGLVVLDFPDSGLAEADPREIEHAIRGQIERLEPQVLVTYPVHGISGFHDHLVSHAVVKRAFVEMRQGLPALQRLAFHTLAEDEVPSGGPFTLHSSPPEEIDCVVEVDPVDIERNLKALDCYVTFQETIEKAGIRDALGRRVAFELFQEAHDPPLTDLFAGVEAGGA